MKLPEACRAQVDLIDEFKPSSMQYRKMMLSIIECLESSEAIKWLQNKLLLETNKDLADILSSLCKSPSSVVDDALLDLVQKDGIAAQLKWGILGVLAKRGHTEVEGIAVDLDGKKHEILSTQIGFLSIARQMSYHVSEHLSH